MLILIRDSMQLRRGRVIRKIGMISSKAMSLSVFVCVCVCLRVCVCVTIIRTGETVEKINVNYDVCRFRYLQSIDLIARIVLIDFDLLLKVTNVKRHCL